jgi:hypothetical protein
MAIGGRPLQISDGASWQTEKIHFTLAGDVELVSEMTDH